MPINQRDASYSEMTSYVARFAELAGVDNGFPEYGIPGYARTMYNVIGFEPPDGAGAEGDGVVVSPVGGGTTPAINLSAGFGLLFLTCEPGNGTPNHNHDTNESFVVLDGSWTFYWGPTELHSRPDHQITLGKLDSISLPPGIPRRFTCVTPGSDGEKGMLLGIVAGDSPRAEYTHDVNEMLRLQGKLV